MKKALTGIVMIAGLTMSILVNAADIVGKRLMQAAGYHFEPAI